MSSKRKDAKVKAVFYSLAVICALIIIMITLSRLSSFAEYVLSDNSIQSLPVCEALRALIDFGL